MGMLTKHTTKEYGYMVSFTNETIKRLTADIIKQYSKTIATRIKEGHLGYIELGVNKSAEAYLEVFKEVISDILSVNDKPDSDKIVPTLIKYDIKADIEDYLYNENNRELMDNPLLVECLHSVLVYTMRKILFDMYGEGVIMNDDKTRNVYLQ